MSTITRFEASNFKRIKVARVDPATGEPIVVVGGMNGEGKSSLLDGIWAVFGGKDASPEVPIRTGEESSQLLAMLSNGMQVTRKFRMTESGRQTTQLEVTERTKNGIVKHNAPQSVLDAMCGAANFDPLAFTRLKPKEQLEKIKELVGINTDELDATEKKLFDERTAVNRLVKQLEGEAAACTTYADAPANEVSVSVLMDQLAVAEQVNREVDRLERDAEQATNTANSQAAKIVEMRRAIDMMEKEHERLVARAEEMVSLVSGTTRTDIAPIKAQVNAADAINSRVRANKAAKSADERLERSKSEAAGLTKAIEDLRVEKQLLIERADWPVDGLGFDDNGLTFNGLPFSQGSQAEQSRVAVNIAIAMVERCEHPDPIKVITIREASLYDSNTRQVVAETAEAKGFQVWMEVVGTEGTIVMEDGEVRAREPAATTEAGYPAIPELAAV